MPKVSQAIKTFLANPKVVHNCRELALWYNENMEVQIMASADNGEPVAEKRNTWSDGINEWGHIRIPKNADTEPFDNDYDMRWPLHDHVAYIGMTGWDWRNKRSLWCGFDFDSITGHAEGVGIPQDELNRVRESVEKIPQAWLFRSTGGNGLHLYLKFDPDNAPKTENHHEHAALARACLSVLANLASYNFEGSLDVCGSNMWVWSRKMTESNQGLSLIKRGESFFDVPINWRDHIDVVTRKRAKVKITCESDGEENDVSNMAASRRVVPLDAMHHTIIERLQELQYSTFWVADHNLLQTHTCALDEVAKRFKNTGDPLQGHFVTLSDGNDPGKPNCFCFPCPNGAFKVVRFGNKATEDKSWCQDSKGWTYCFFNRKLDLSLAAATFGGEENPSRGGGYTFQRATSALEAVKSLGASFNLPQPLVDHPATLREHSDGRVIVEIPCRPDEIANRDITGFIQQKGKIVRIINVQATPPEIADEDPAFDIGKLDQMLRTLLTPAYDEAGWAWHDTEMNQWHRFSKDNIRSALKAQNYESDVVEKILGHSILKSWTLVNIPFAVEYPGNRQWNHDAAQLRFKPAQISDDFPPVHPHWDRILAHCGNDLTASIKEMSWAKKAGVRDGKDYLLFWVAMMIRYPFSPLPYLFFFGPQNSGKSIFHEAISLLIENNRGVVQADHALKNANGFNGELASAVMCVIEETDLTHTNSQVYNLIKDWVTSPSIAIHAKHKQVYSQRNTTHWIQCSNERSSLPVFPGDTRITMSHVPALDEEIPKERLLSLLEAEAPQFMATIMSIQLPEPEYRLRLPIVVTCSKEQAEYSNQNPLLQFLNDNYFWAPGEHIVFKDFNDSFYESLTQGERTQWSKRKVQQEFPQKYMIGKYKDNLLCIANISTTEPTDLDTNKAKIVMRNGRLILEDTHE